MVTIAEAVRRTMKAWRMLLLGASTVVQTSGFDCLGPLLGWRIVSSCMTELWAVWDGVVLPPRLARRVARFPNTRTIRARKKKKRERKNQARVRFD